MENFDLIIKYLNNEANAEEKKTFELWLAESNENQKQFDSLKQTWLLSNQSSKEIQNINIEAEWSKINAHLKDNTQGKIKSISNKTYSRKSFLQIAASIIILLSIGTVLLSRESQTLIIFAEKGILDQELPDGTSICLNKNASLEYTQEFNKNERFVKLQGDANFDVAHNPEKPFIIDAGNINIKVLGTSFMVHAPKNSKYREVIVEKGKVEVKSKNKDGSENKVILVKGQKVIFDVETNSVRRAAIDQNYNAWRTKIFRFVDAPMHLVARRLSQAYHHEIIIPNQKTMNCPITVEGNKESFEVIIDRIEENYNREILFKKKSDRYEIHGSCR